MGWTAGGQLGAALASTRTLVCDARRAEHRESSRELLAAAVERARTAVDAWLKAALDHDVVSSHQLGTADDLGTVFEADVTYRNRLFGHGAAAPVAFYRGPRPARRCAAGGS